MRLSESLVGAEKLNSVSERERSSLEKKSQKKNIEIIQETRPMPEIRFDLVDHMPRLDTNKEGKRCKNNCNKKTHFYCDKCKIHLCITKHKNCFVLYHRK